MQEQLQIRREAVELVPGEGCYLAFCHGLQLGGGDPELEFSQLYIPSATIQHMNILV